MTDHLRPNIFPALRYADADAGIAFLKHAFGATEKAVHRGDDGVIHHAELALGSGPGHGRPASRGRQARAARRRDALASTISLYVTVDDPDAHHATAREAGRHGRARA